MRLDAVRLVCRSPAEERIAWIVTKQTRPNALRRLPANQSTSSAQSVPVNVQDGDPGLASGVTPNRWPTNAAEKLGNKTIRHVLPQQRQHLPVGRRDEPINRGGGADGAPPQSLAPCVENAIHGRDHRVQKKNACWPSALNEQSWHPCTA